MVGAASVSRFAITRPARSSARYVGIAIILRQKWCEFGQTQSGPWPWRSNARCMVTQYLMGRL